MTSPATGSLPSSTHTLKNFLSGGSPVNYKAGPKAKTRKHFQRAYCGVSMARLLPGARAADLPSP